MFAEEVIDILLPGQFRGLNDREILDQINEEIRINK